jgi:hypothetical protein
MRVGIAPDIPVASIGAGLAAPRTLKPRMLVGGVIDHQFRDHAQVSALGFLHEAPKILHGAEVGIDLAVIGDVVAVVAAGRRIERQQPQSGDAQLLQVIKPLGQPGKVANTVIVAVGERFDVKLIDDGVFEPETVVLDLLFGLDFGLQVHVVAFVMPGSGRVEQGPEPGRWSTERRPTRSRAARR